MNSTLSYVFLSFPIFFASALCLLTFKNLLGNLEISKSQPFKVKGFNIHLKIILFQKNNTHSKGVWSCEHLPMVCLPSFSLPWHQTWICLVGDVFTDCAMGFITIELAIWDNLFGSLFSGIKESQIHQRVAFSKQKSASSL